MVQQLLAAKREGCTPTTSAASSSAASARRSRSSAPSSSGRHARPLLRPPEAVLSATVPAPRPVTARRNAALRATLWDYAHLTALSSFAVAQPLFGLLRQSPVFDAARGALGFDVVSFAIVLVALPPALLLAVELLAGLVDRRARRGPAPGLRSRARGAGRRRGDQPIGRRRRRRPDRGVGGDRDRRGRRLRAHRGGEVVHEHPLGRPGPVPGAVSLRRPPCPHKPSRTSRAPGRSQAPCGRRSWSCSSTSSR